MNKIVTVLLVILLLPAVLWGLFALRQVYLTQFGAFVIPNVHSIDTFASPILKQALLTGFQATIALFIVAIIAHFARKTFIANTGFALGIGIFAGIFILGLLQYRHVTDILSTIPAAANISAIEYSTSSDPFGHFSFVYSFSWQKASSLPQEIQMYKTVLQFYQAYFSSAYDINFHTDITPTKRCLDGVDTAYNTWEKQKRITNDAFSFICTAKPNVLNIVAIILKPGNGLIIFR